MDGIGFTMLSSWLVELPPPGAGLKTPTEIAPVLVKRVDGTVAVRLVGLRKVVAKSMLVLLPRDVIRITDALVKINSIENQADDIFDMSIDRLFETEPDAKEVIKKREIYQVMEVVTDKCEDAANVIESIIIKYA